MGQTDPFEFVRRELQALAAEVGEAAARLPRDVLIERGVAHGHKREALEVAVTVTVIHGIFDERSARRCLDLNDARQRIHAGFLIDTVPTGPIPDLKPEEARDALQTTDILVRKVVEWLGEQKNSPNPTTP